MAYLEDHEEHVIGMDVEYTPSLKREHVPVEAKGSLDPTLLWNKMSPLPGVLGNRGEPRTEEIHPRI